ncbi:hypothetical protein ELE36_01245 [Pseudolysobacter antarcticus]|uniref:Uncharacterized protein n=1 Tax=Pseudolysobacter antarcticus TaxID=2511995 RepID=A0A411HF66_9GAMM|nr:hypothetical protein [Pseudolysobacter antarcticus]QBB69117.1 hypothetical protein ELE36_01245 [Pseudolysobacter antarcticus]
MEVTIISPMAERCELCGRCVEVALIGNELDFDAPSFQSECEREGCPANAKNQPGPVDNISVYFVEDDACG